MNFTASRLRRPHITYYLLQDYYRIPICSLGRICSLVNKVVDFLVEHKIDGVQVIMTRQWQMTMNTDKKMFLSGFGLFLYKNSWSLADMGM